MAGSKADSGIEILWGFRNIENKNIRFNLEQGFEFLIVYATNGNASSVDFKRIQQQLIAVTLSESAFWGFV